MWVEEKNGVLRVVDRYKGLDGKLHKASVVVTKDTPQAHRKAQNELAELIRYKSACLEEIGLYEALDRYFKQKEVKDTTLANEQSAMGQFKRIVGDMFLNDLKPHIVKRKLSESGKSPKTLNRYLIIFNHFAKWALEYGYLAKELKVAPFPVGKKEKKPESELYLEKSELKSVLDALNGTMDGYMCRFLALTGCRIGEAIALTLDDIEGDYIHITKTSTWLRTIQTPKTATSKRDIFIQPELRAMLREYHEWRMLYLMAHGIRTDLLFFNNFGDLFCRGSFHAHLHELDPKLHPHIFRHTHVALMAEAGLSLEAISARLGHADSAVTKSIYMHVTDSVKKRNEELISKVYIL